MNLEESIKKFPYPKHIAIIMDGNGRWAKNRGKLRIFGHENGTKSVKNIVESCSNLGIQCLTSVSYTHLTLPTILPV